MKIKHWSRMENSYYVVLLKLVLLSFKIIPNSEPINNRTKNQWNIQQSESSNLDVRSQKVHAECPAKVGKTGIKVSSRRRRRDPQRRCLRETNRHPRDRSSASSSSPQIAKGARCDSMTGSRGYRGKSGRIEEKRKAVRGSEKLAERRRTRGGERGGGGELLTDGCITPVNFRGSNRAAECKTPTPFE